MTDIWPERKRNKETENAQLALLRQSKITDWRRHLPLPGKPDFGYQLIAKATYLRLRLRFPSRGSPSSSTDASGGVMSEELMGGRTLLGTPVVFAQFLRHEYLGPA